MTDLKRGDQVRVRRSGSSEGWSAGTIALSSHNGRSIAVMLDEAVPAGKGGMIVGVLPLIHDLQRGAFMGVMTGDTYELEITQQQETT
jgi:hypothetical protein